VDPFSRAAWIQIRPESSFLTLPNEVANDPQTLAYTDPVSPLLYTTGAKDIWFALPAEADSALLDRVIDLAWTLGYERGVADFNFRITQGEADAAGYEGYQVIAIGRPTANPFIASLNDQLPQPFVDGEDALKQQIGNLVYRLPAEYSVGLVEVLPAPWQPDRAISVISGTSDEGVAWALNAFLDPDLRDSLTEGEVSFVRDRNIETIRLDASPPPLDTVVDEALGEEDVTLEPVEATPEPDETAAETVEVPDPPAPQPTLIDRVSAINPVVFYAVAGGLALLIVLGVVLALRSALKSS
jgi:hypothetical protein